ncbi:MAG: glycosyltransferase [Balneolales bacterium]
MKRVLLFAPYFPPRRRVGSYRAFKFAIHLRKFGWDPLVVHLREKNERLSEREKEFLREVPCIPLSTPLDLTASSSGSYAPGKDQPGTTRKFMFSDYFDRAFPVDTWWPVFSYHHKTLQRIVREFKPDVLWSTADPWSVHLAAMKIARNHNIPWIADFRDPWTLCPVRSRGRMPWARAMDKRAEKSILENADHVTFTAENTAKRYLQHYTALTTPVSTIYNSFDDVFFKPLQPNKPADAEDEGKFRIMFYGRFRALSPAGPAVGLMEAVKKMDPDVYKTVTLQSSGSLPAADVIRADRAGVYGAFETIPAEPYENTLNCLGQADMLLLSTEPGRDEIIPAKFWDYLAAGKPILSFSQNPEIDEILRRTNTGRQFALTETGEAAALVVRCHNAWRQGKSLPFSDNAGHSRIQRYSSRCTTAQLAGLFDQLSKKGQSYQK